MLFFLIAVAASAGRCHRFAPQERCVQSTSHFMLGGVSSPPFSILLSYSSAGRNASKLFLRFGVFSLRRGAGDFGIRIPEIRRRRQHSAGSFRSVALTRNMEFSNPFFIMQLPGSFFRLNPERPFGIRDFPGSFFPRRYWTQCPFLRPSSCASGGRGILPSNRWRWLRSDFRASRNSYTIAYIKASCQAFLRLPLHPS